MSMDGISSKNERPLTDYVLRLKTVENRMTPITILGKVENRREFFVAGGWTKGFLKFKGDLICLAMF